MSGRQFHQEVAFTGPFGFTFRLYFFTRYLMRLVTDEKGKKMIIKINGTSINTSDDPKYNEIDNDIFSAMMQLWEETSGIKIDESMDMDFVINVETKVEHFEEKLF